MNEDKFMLPSFVLRLAVRALVLADVAACVPAMGSDSVGPLAGFERVVSQDNTTVTNRFVPFSADFASVFAGQMDGGTNRWNSDRFSWKPLGGDAVEFWKVELLGHELDGLLVVGESLDDAAPVTGVLAPSDELALTRKTSSQFGDFILGGSIPTSLIPSNGWFHSVSMTPPSISDMAFDVNEGTVTVVVSNGTANAVALFSKDDGTVSQSDWLLKAVLPIGEGGMSWTEELPSTERMRLYLAKDAQDDTDGDGMSDVWEMTNGLDPFSPLDATADPDGDGLDNLFEYANGLDPHFFDLDPRHVRSGLVARGWFFDSIVTSITCMASAPPRDCFIFDADVNFPGTNEPWNGFDSRYTDQFALSLTGWIRIDTSGTYTFYMASDDGATLFIDGQRRVNDGKKHAFHWRSATVALTAGWHRIALEYFENKYDAAWVLEWIPPDGVRTVVPHALFAHLAEEEILPPNVVWAGPTETYAPGNAVPLGVEAWDFGEGIERVDYYEGGTNFIASSTNEPFGTLWHPASADSPVVVAVAHNFSGLTAAATGSVAVLSAPESGYAYGLDAFYYRSSVTISQMPEMPAASATLACTENDVSSPIGLLGQTFWPSDVTNNYSSAYEGWLVIRMPGEYEFSLGSDDGSRLILDGETVINAPKPQSFTARNALCSLGAGFHHVRVEYFQRRGDAELWLKWRMPGDKDFSLVPPTAFFRALGVSATADTDGDGMTDWWERNFYLDPINSSDAVLDADGDGLTNLEEFTHGTHPRMRDTDGDGMPDSWEIGQGLNPLFGADGGYDPDGDGATNRQEYEAGTDIHVADTDNDGVLDGEEINERFSDPLVADFNGTVVPVGRLTPADATGGLGNWVRYETELHLVGRSGRIDFTNGFVLAQGGVFQLRMDGLGEKSGDAAVRCLVDGVEVGTAELVGFSSATSSACFYTPWLNAGRHSLSLDFRNVDNGFSFHVFGVGVNLPAGPDGNADGIPDWVDARLSWSRPDRRGAVSSKVSPFCMTGRAIFPELVRVAGAGIHPLPDRGWWTNVALSADVAVTVPLSFESGGRTEDVLVEWSETDLTVASNTTLRVGDSLLLSGSARVQVTGATNTIMMVEGRLPFLFPSAGTYYLMPQNAGGAALRPMPLVVSVVTGELPSHLPAWKGKVNSLVVPDVPWVDVVFRADREIGIDASDAGQDGVRLTLECPVYRGTRARTIAVFIDNPDASVLCSCPIAGFTAYYTLDGEFYAYRREADGTLVVQNRVSGFDIPPDVTLRMKTQSGVCFADGSGQLFFSAADFDQMGDYYYQFFVPPEVTNPCQFLRATWEGREIAQ